MIENLNYYNISGLFLNQNWKKKHTIYFSFKLISDDKISNHLIKRKKSINQFQFKIKYQVQCTCLTTLNWSDLSCSQPSFLKDTSKGDKQWLK